VHYRAALALDPDFDDAHRNLANALRTKRRFGEAEQHYRAAAAANPRDPDTFEEWGRMLALLGRNDEAREQLWRSIELAQRARVVALLGVIAMREGKAAEGAHYFGIARYLNDRLANVMRHLAAALAGAGQPERALHFAEVALARRADAVGHALHARVLWQTGEGRAALAAWQRALQLDPDLEIARFELGWMLASETVEQGGDPVAALELARAVGPSSASGYAWRALEARALAQLGRAEPAAQTARVAAVEARAFGRADVAAALERRAERYSAGERPEKPLVAPPGLRLQGFESGPSLATSAPASAG
jgi:tetratricopeptide (TPR) repeat protein